MSLNQDSGRMMKVLLAALFVLINATVSGGTELRDDTRQAWNAYVRGVKLVTHVLGFTMLQAFRVCTLGLGALMLR
jgi:hypothetical protein